MQDLRRRPRFPLLAACAVLLSACGNPGYNDNPSQQRTNARLGCLAEGDLFSAYFSVHLLPAEGSGDARATRDMFRAYCGEIPGPGTVFLTVDLVGGGLNEAPVAVRVAEAGPGGAGVPAEEGNSDQSLLEIPARTYPGGAIQARFELDRNGAYIVELIRENGGTGSGIEKLEIPLQVGPPAGAGFWGSLGGMLFGVAGLAAAGFLALRNGRKPKGD
jgi:hypothetical protein